MGSRIARIGALLVAVVVICAGLVVGALSAGAVTSYDQYTVFGEHGVFVGAGSDIKGLTGARHNNPFDVNEALKMNGGSEIGSPTLIADARVGEDVNFQNNVTITGTLFYVGTLTTGASPTFGSPPQQVADADLPAGPIPSAWPTSGVHGPFATYCGVNHTPDISVANSQTIHLDQTGGGTYGDISGGGNTTLEFDVAGDYFLDSLAMGNSSTYKIDAPNVRLFVCSQATIGGADTTGVASPAQFYIEVGGFGLTGDDLHHNTYVQGGGQIVANVVVPIGGIHFGSSGGGTTILGHMWADTIDIEHGVVLTQPATKSCFKFNDVNGNGIQDAGDLGLPGWKIYVDVDNSGTFTPGDPFDVTDANGNCLITNIPEGTFTVREVPQAGWSCTHPAPDPNCLYTETFHNGENVATNVFGNHQAGPEIVKKGIKFNDVDHSGTYNPAIDTLIDGWPINFTNSSNTTTPFVTGAGGVPGQWGPTQGLSPDTYTICEGPPPVGFTGFTQTFPNAGTPDPFPFDKVIHTCPAPNTWGYQLTITAGMNVPGGVIDKDDFGNAAAPVCKEDPASAPKLTRTVNLSQPVGGLGVPGTPANYWTLQAAYDAAKASAQSEVIGMFSKTNERDVLDGNKSLTITQCESAQLTADTTGPVIKVTNTKPLTIVSADTVGGSIGWELVTGGHTLKSIRANDSAGPGVKIDAGSNGNKIGWNRIDNNGSGIDVGGNTNTLTGGSLTGNKGVGVHIATGATANTLKDATVTSSLGDGVFVQGSGNTLNNVTVDSNKGDGIHVTAASTSIVSSTAVKNVGDGFDVSGGATSATANSFKNDVSNTGSAGGSSENGGAEFRVLDYVNNPSGSSDKADNIVIPKTTNPKKCELFPAANSTKQFAAVYVCE